MRWLAIVFLLLTGCESRSQINEQSMIDRQGTMTLVGTYAGEPFELQMQFQGQEQAQKQAQVVTHTSSPFSGLLSSLAPMAKLIAGATGFGGIAAVLGSIGTAATIGGGLWMQSRRRRMQEQRDEERRELAELPPEQAKERLQGMIRR